MGKLGLARTWAEKKNRRVSPARVIEKFRFVGTGHYHEREKEEEEKEEEEEEEEEDERGCSNSFFSWSHSKKVLIQAGISRKARSRVPIFVKFPIAQPRPKYVIMIVVVTAGKRASKSGLEAEARFTLARPRDRRTRRD
ncbi:hypothetical protein V1478_017106 [Vespula squamosa]|uniref:Uncharacterized protein n=1 Tax=Vespula squamosa TaxID=30214 RepID=A0ABD1ZYK6_VESSQ